jgi:acyl-CoA thioester hydrolase
MVGTAGETVSTAPPALPALESQDRVSPSSRSIDGGRNQEEPMADAHELEIRVRYQETDGQRRVHHANFLTYFEMGRTEMLRAHGHTYRAFEDAGLFMVVSEARCQYLAPAEYDDLLLLRTRVEKVGAAHIKHAYEVIRDGRIIVTGSTTVVCVDREGRVRRLPDWMLA